MGGWRRDGQSLHAALHREQATRTLGDLGNARVVKPFMAAFTSGVGATRYQRQGAKRS
jgi:hypothetical protein